MQALKLDALSGWRWVTGGWRLFRSQPFSFVVLLFFSWLVLFSASAAIGWLAEIVGTALPFVSIDFLSWVGGLLVALFAPALTVGFQQGCRAAAGGLPVHPALLFAPFRAGRATLVGLLVLGAVQVVALAGIVWLVSGSEAFRPDPPAAPPTTAAPAANPSPGKSTTAAPAPAPKDTGTPREPTEAEQQATLRSTVQRIKLGLAYSPVALLMWYAPLLVAWHGVPPGKALFFSVVAVWRNRFAFVVYGLSWLVIALLVGIVLTTVLLGLGSFGAILAAPVVMLLSTCMYCSVYPTYTTVFVDPSTLPATAPLSTTP